MRRAFTSLYIIIVAAIVLIGWGMDAVWEAWNSEPVLSDYEEALLHVVESDLAEVEASELEQRLEQLNQNLAIELRIYNLDDLSSTELSTVIVEGKAVPVKDQHGNLIIYHRLGQTQHVLALKQHGEPAQNGSVYFILLVVFYLCLALVIYIWVWPLSRDLNRLEKQTRLVGKDGAAPLVELRRGSHVQALADAFNSMSVRIKELLASRKEMTYAVSHELRTPLARMKFALEMAAETPDVHLMREQLLSVREDVAALDKFVSEFLNYASFDQSEQRLDMQEGDFLAFCQSIVGELENESVQIKILAHDENLHVSCDWQLMERVITNLLQNALRYAEKNVQVVLARKENHFLVCVEDDGPGIPEQERARVFQSFVRLQHKQDKKGYGLGLAIVKRIMQWHGGKASVTESSLGGACFVLSWPLST